MRLRLMFLAVCESVCLAHASATTNYFYDSVNRFTRVVYSDGTTIAYTYDSAGNRLSQIITSPSTALPTVGTDKTSLSFSGTAGQGSAGSQVLTIRNSGGGTLQWNVSASVSWLSFSVSSGTNDATITVTASTQGLQAGNYTGNIVIYASASNTPVTISVSFAVAGGSGRPAISSGGIVSAASYQPALSRGSIASLFGAALSDATASEVGLPLPRALAGVTVSVNGVNVPLWFVSPGQINFQAPFEMPMTGSVPVVVSKNGVASQAATAQVQEYAPGVFTYERTSGIFDPIVTRLDGSLVGPSNRAAPAETLVVWGTGIGNLTVTPPTGDVAPLSPLAKAQLTPTITLGGSPVEVQFAGLAPGAVGLAQFNIHLPAALPKTDFLPLVIQFGTASSQPVNLAIRSDSPARPDVTMQITDVQPRTPLATDKLWLAEDVKNPSHFSGDLITKLYVSESPQVAADSAHVSAPTTLTLVGTDGSFTWSGIALPQGLKAGVYYVAVGTMFPGNTGPEGVVLSNSLQIEIVDQRPPFDLAVQLQGVSPSVVGVGDPITVHYSVSEPGGMSGTFSRSIYLSTDPSITTSDTLINARTFDLVKGSFELTATGNSIPRSVTPGNYYVGVIVQTSGDTDPANNTSSAVQVTVTSQRTPFDVGVQIVSVTPTTIAPGGTFTVTYNVKNTSKTTGIYSRWIYLSTDQTINTADQLLSTGTFSLAGADAQFTTSAITLPTSVAAGTYYIGIIAENQGDTNPDDNVSAGFAIHVGSSTGTNSLPALNAAEPVGGSENAIPDRDSRLAGQPQSESGGLPENGKVRPIPDRR